MTEKNGDSWSAFFGKTLISAIISTGLITVILGAVLHERTATISASVTADLEKGLHTYRSRTEWKQKSVGELLGPMVMQLERTRRAFHRYEGNQIWLEARVLCVGNITVRNLLLTKAHLIPLDLHKEAHDLVEHYDVWLEEFQNVRGGGSLADPCASGELKTDDKFVFAGPKGFIFPQEAEAKFRNRFETMWAELYAQ